MPAPHNLNNHRMSAGFLINSTHAFPRKQESKNIVSALWRCEEVFHQSDFLFRRFSKSPGQQ